MKKLAASDISVIGPQLSAPPRKSEASRAALRWSVDDGMRIHSIHGPALALLEPAPGKLKGATLVDAFPPHEPAGPIVAAHHRALRGESQSLEVEWAGRTFSVHLEPLTDGNGKVCGVIGIAWNTGEDFDLVAEAENRYDALMQNSSEVSLLLAADGRIFFVSASCSRILGYEREEIIGRSYSDLLHPSDRPVTACMMAELFEQPGRVGTVDARFRVRDGSWQWMRCASANRLQAASVGAVVVNAHDITGLRRAELERGVFLEVIDALNRTSKLDELLAKVHGSLQKVIYAENCSVALYNRQSRKFHFPFFVDQREAGPPENGRGCGAYVFRRGEPLLIGSKALDELIAAGEVEMAGSRPCSWLGVPLRTPSATIGVLAVQHYQDENAYSGRDLELLTSIGGEIALAIERKQAEDTFRREQKEHEIIFHSAPSMIWYKDTENRILRANRAAAQSLNMKIEEVEGRSAYDLFPSEAVHYHQDDLEVVRTGQPKLGIVEPYRLPSGEVRTVRTDKIPYRDASGRIVGVLVFSTDITERQRAEEAMRRSELNYRSVVQGAPYGICRASQDGRLLTVNPAMAEMLGYGSEEELLAVSLDRDIFCEPGARDNLLQARGEVLEGVEVGWRRKDGTPIQVRLSGRPVQDPEWPSTCYELIAENVTGQHALEQQLRQAQKMEAVGRLAGGVAHDFNNLLMVIKGHAELLLDCLQGDPGVSHKVEQIERAADRAAQLTRQLLAFSRMQILQPKVLNLSDVVADMGKMLPRLIGEDIELEMAAEPGLARVKADPGQIEQVIMNLAVNARDAMPRGGKLVIRAANAEIDDAFARRSPPLVAGSYVVLTVSDTGMGMDAETQARIFEPFFTTKEVGKGTGLGLSTVYGVIKQSGGYVCVESTEGAGTTFRIYLPRVEKESQPVGNPPMESKVPSGSGTILLAEDERDVRELAREFLSLSGYTVLEARDGAEALEIARTHHGPIDLLIADVVMPRLGGRELAMQMAELRPETKVLYMSGYAQFSSAREEGSDQPLIALSKPFTRTALARAVGQVLQPLGGLSGGQ